jgi:hypothetical protein
MDYQADTWSLIPFVVFRPDEHVNVPFEVMLQYPAAKQLRPESIDLFVRMNGPDSVKFAIYLNRMRSASLFGAPMQIPRLMTCKDLVSFDDNQIYEFTSPVVLSEWELMHKPIEPVIYRERRSFFFYTREIGDFHIETSVTMFDDRVLYDEICVYNDRNVQHIPGDAHTFPFRDIVFHWQIIQYNQMFNHFKCPVETFDFSHNSVFHLVNLSERVVQEVSFGHWDIYLKLLAEHNRLSKMDKNSFEKYRLSMIKQITSDDISNMRSIRIGVNIRSVFENLVSTRLMPIIEEQEYLDEEDDDAWLW